MSRFLYRNLELLEPYEGKLSCTVLRGESSRKGADLPDHFYPNSSTLKVFLKSGSTYVLNIQTGNVTYEGVKKRPVFYQFSYLHYNPGNWWIYFSDLFAACLILICISGILINKGKRGLFGIGGIELLAGILIPILALFL